MPELSTAQSEGGSYTITQLVLQFLGMSSGFGTMLLIALYEHDLERIFTN